MNNDSLPEPGAPRPPDVHLLVPPIGQEAALALALADDRSHPVLAWRKACKTLQTLTDKTLYAALSDWLEKGHIVTVWHGHEPWDAGVLRLQLGKTYAAGSSRLFWSELSVPAGTSDNAWSALAEKLNQPDPADLRLWLYSMGRQRPSWSLPPEQVAQGLDAFERWILAHVDLSLIDGDADEVDPAATTNEADDIGPLDWPWKHQREWEAGAWIKAYGTQQISNGNMPANDERFALRAGSLKAGSPEAETWQARLHPVDSETPGSAGSTAPSVELLSVISASISRPADDPDAVYLVQVSFLEEASESGASWRGCLWLHPSGGLPLALDFERTPGQKLINLPWPNPRSLDDPYRPCEDLWQAICEGSVSLEQY